MRKEDQDAAWVRIILRQLKDMSPEARDRLKKEVLDWKGKGRGGARHEAHFERNFETWFHVKQLMDGTYSQSESVRIIADDFGITEAAVLRRFKRFEAMIKAPKAKTANL